MKRFKLEGHDDESPEVLFQGRPVNKCPGYVRSHIGYMPQRFSLYQDLTVWENLRFFGDLFGVPRRDLEERIRRLYGFSGLAPFKARRAGALSGGMKQKLALSCMLVHAPEVVVLDEPALGVDPVSRNDFWVILKSLSREGTTILVSTAYMNEALLCDRVALVFKGQLLATDTPSRLREHFTDPLYLVKTGSPHVVHHELLQTQFCGQCSLFGDGVHFTLTLGISAGQVAEHLKASMVEFQEVRRIEPGLEDLFLKLLKE